MDRTKIILHLHTHRWIGPRFLLPDNWFTQDGSRLTLRIKMSEKHLKLFKVVFLKQDHLQLIEGNEAPKLFMPAIAPSGRVIARINEEFSKNKLWERYMCLSYVKLINKQHKA